MTSHNTTSMVTMRICVLQRKRNSITSPRWRLVAGLERVGCGSHRLADGPRSGVERHVRPVLGAVAQVYGGLACRVDHAVDGWSEPEVIRGLAGPQCQLLVPLPTGSCAEHIPDSDPDAEQCIPSNLHRSSCVHTYPPVPGSLTPHSNRFPVNSRVKTCEQVLRAQRPRSTSSRCTGGLLVAIDGSGA